MADGREIPDDPLDRLLEQWIEDHEAGAGRGIEDYLRAFPAPA